MFSALIPLHLTLVHPAVPEDHPRDLESPVGGLLMMEECQARGGGEEGGARGEDGQVRRCWVWT